MAFTEPTLESLPHPLARYALATRPPFLVASLVPCLLGLATVYFSGVPIDPLNAWLTVIGALLAHGGINVLNDYYDALNGTDAANTERLFPFTGGSRFIQNGVLTPEETARLGWVLLGTAALIGVYLTAAAGWLLVGVGLVGLLIGWAYSAPPLQLNARGLGEPSVAVGFGILMPFGTDLVQRGSADPTVVLVSVPYACLVTALLYVNQFPDRRADATAGKRHWVVRLGPARARWGYLALVVVAHAWLLGTVLAGALPAWVLLGLVSLGPGLLASRDVIRHAADPERLRPAIQLTILAMIMHGVLVALGLLVAGSA
jgi:1,4-dihydroxy-2-naphthoate octaprenyltransferase